MKTGDPTKRGFGLLAALLFLSSVSLAAGEKSSRPCTKQDLIGTWDMVSVKPVRDKNDPVFFRYQRFVFNANSSMKFVSSEKPLTKDWLGKLAKQPAEIDYSLSDKGLLTLTWQKRPHSEAAICGYVLRDVPPELLAKVPIGQRGSLPKKGDITLSFLNSSGKIAYQKVLKKVA